MSPPPPDPVDGLDLSTLRASYRAGELVESALAADWLTQFETWFATAAADPAVVEANAMQLATVDPDGRPDVRTVLAKSVTGEGVTFYTNHDSAKGRQLAGGHAAVVFSWLAQERQVRLRGPVTRVPRETTQEYFATRPRGSQLGAWASPQSQVIADRGVLDARLVAVSNRFGDGPVTVPDDWGGYLLQPVTVEFWQGRENRLHDRLRYRRTDADWVVERLAP